jgi:ubiquinone/menaquinone biosynthesis C-methylase UbiE
MSTPTEGADADDGQTRDGQAADVYTHGHHDSVLRSHRWRTAENSAAYLLPSLQPGQRLADIGCGPGTLTVDLAARVAPGAVVGVDVDGGVLDEARATAASAGLDMVRFVAGDFRLGTALDADLQPGSFDVVHAHQVLQHLADPVGALRAMAALVKPGGVVAVRDADYAAMFWSPADVRLDRWLQLYRAVARRNRAEPDAGRWLPLWAAQAGLTDVTYTVSTWTYTSPADRQWWGSLWADRIVHSAMAAQAVDYGRSTTDELADLSAGWREWSTADHGVFVIPHGELLARV